MSEPPVVISGNVDLNGTEIGNIICANGATTLNISTAKDAEAVIGDSFILMRDTASAVSVTADVGITIKSVGSVKTIASQNGGVTVVKIAASVWWLRGDI